jgi:hypothetical protein
VKHQPEHNFDQNTWPKQFWPEHIAETKLYDVG